MPNRGLPPRSWPPCATPHISLHRRTDAPTHRRTDAPTHRRTDAPTHRRTGATSIATAWRATT
ncbi:hypothetical protein E9529_20475 [Blastococcus sp. KM273128]|nr:hypothetical protein [Blastococcus sp. KM273128]